MTGECNQALNLLGLAQKAGKVVSGEGGVESAVRKQKVVLLILASDASPNTKKNFHDMAVHYKVAIIEGPDMNALGGSVGKSRRSIIALTDKGFSKTAYKAFTGIEFNI